MEKSGDDDNASIRSNIESLRRGSPDTLLGGTSEEPPAYGDIATASSSSFPFGASSPSRSTIPPGLPTLDFAAYRPPGSTLTSDQTTLLVPFNKLSSPFDFLVKQASLPPRPLVRINGKHRAYEVSASSSSSRQGLTQVEDFDVCLDMMSCFLSRSGAGSLDNVVGGAEALRARFDQFLGETEINKHFVLDRRLAFFDKGFLAGCARSLLEELQYCGNVNVTFPSTHSRVVIENSAHSPPRHSPRILEKSTLRIFDVEAVWRPHGVYVTGRDGGDSAQAFVEQWWETWKKTIRHAVLSKHKGLIGNEHWMDVAMGSVDVQEQREPWGKHLW